MKYNLRCLICRGFKDCISKYIFVIVFSALLLVIARHTTVPVQNILYNISSSLFALPIIFICYDVYQIIITRKQRKMVTIQINDKIEELFTDFIFMTAKFRTDFDSATVASPDFLDLRNSTSNQIFQDISSTEHYGFFIFSYFFKSLYSASNPARSRMTVSTCGPLFSHTFPGPFAFCRYFSPSVQLSRTVIKEEPSSV